MTGLVFIFQLNVRLLTFPVFFFFFLGLLVTAGGMKRWGVRAAFLSHVTKVDARENARITTLTPMFYTAC